jgi:hypothetical protein
LFGIIVSNRSFDRDLELNKNSSGLLLLSEIASSVDAPKAKTEVDVSDGVNTNEPASDIFFLLIRK